MSNTGLIVAGAGLTIGLTILATHLTKTGATASKLDIILDEFSFSGKKGGSGVVFHAKLRINNPTKDSLTISQPYLKVFYKDTVSPVGVSPPSDTTYKLKPKKTTPLDVYVEFPNSKILPKMPDMLVYFLKRVAGAPSTRKAAVEIQVEGNGINQTIVQRVDI